MRYKEVEVMKSNEYLKREIERLTRNYSGKSNNEIDNFYLVYTHKFMKRVLIIASVSTLFCLLTSII